MTTKYEGKYGIRISIGGAKNITINFPMLRLTLYLAHCTATKAFLKELTFQTIPEPMPAIQKLLKTMAGML
jgi:hypothetical protein